jgi:enoyl-CoA hydratase
MNNKEEYRYLQPSVEGKVMLIEMNRPPANAFNLEFIAEFSHIINAAARDLEIRVVVISSKVETFFCAGADIKQMFTVDARMVQNALTNLFSRIQELPKPVIAMIQGNALGGGCELALCCDFRFMERDSARIGLPEIKLGIVPAAGGTQRLCRLIGKAKAIELLFEGNAVSADTAVEIGLVHKVFDRDELKGKTLEYAHRLSKQAPVAVALIKKCINEGVDADLKRGLEIEGDALISALQTEDAQEGILAYLEKRAFEFKGR